MILTDIACIVFICVTMNHLGLISKVEEVMGRELPIVNCPKCGSFWLSLIYLLGKFDEFMGNISMVLAISFFASYSALWLELIEAYIDTLYMKLYEKIYESAADAPATGADNGDPQGSVSELRQSY